VSLRSRLTLVAAAAVAIAVVVASVVVYFVVRDQLRSSVDDALRGRAAEIVRQPPPQVFFSPERAFGVVGYVQLLRSDGTCRSQGGASCLLPYGPRSLAVARGTHRAYFADVTVSQTHLRVLTFPYVPNFAVQIARPLEEVDRSLSRIRWFLLVIAGGGVAVAVALGLLVSRTALAPVRRLMQATERVKETGDLSQRIDARGEDELSRLAGSFNTMLSALAESRRVQRQLVEDASHELRTPLTSMRTNIEVLSRERTLPADERARLLDDVMEQLGEMTALVSELIELARGEQKAHDPDEVRLDVLVNDAVERARRRAPDLRFTTDLSESVVRGVPPSIERAVGNLLDNAAKWSPPGGEVEVVVRDGTVVVRDHGPGITDEDLPSVFDRFYRAESARRMPGSGLGLAIVRQVAETHGGSVLAERADGGGTAVSLHLHGS
jgi:two-component system, OmpR family, sensor histidine kinase MprB